MQTLSIQNRQRTVRFDLRWLRRISLLALEKCREESADGKFALKALEEVDVAIVSDRVIARVHMDFMAVPGATDVITFEHGEIVISAETARENAAHYGHAIEQELALYTVHGLLHLNGFEDSTSRDFKRMHQVQDRILRECIDQLPVPEGAR
ncbi:MAG: ybeY [Chthoniobacteraceae bacterium]|nr:ybeY [Chthoniobacteraceae bacterium]